jgi:tetratricopeptide (TPR) repeat protein
VAPTIAIRPVRHPCDSLESAAAAWILKKSDLRVRYSPRKLVPLVSFRFQEVLLSCSRRILVLWLILVTLPCAATGQSKATLDVSETLFSVVSAMNVCGYDAELQSSSPIRMEVRADLAEANKTPEATAAETYLCRYYVEHRQGDSAHDLAQYVSLALNLGSPPDFAPKVPESDMPPDSTYVLGVIPPLKKYYAAAKLHSIWMKHKPQYLALIDEYHEPVAKMITATDNYLRMPSSGYAGRSFTIYLEPMAAPGQVNSRNYMQDYYHVVVSPVGENLHMADIRHTYLHFVLDPLIAKRATALQRLKPVLAAVQKAPMSAEYKEDAGLLVTECLIRAIEARTPSDPKLPENDRQAMVRLAEAEGFVLTGYFYNQLKAFEKGGSGLQSVFPDWLHNMDIDHERKLASEMQYATHASPEVMQAAKPAPQQKVVMAERALASGDTASAEALANEALQAKEDTARAYFVLARAATMNGNMQGAQENFQKALDASKDPRISAWCHIYLGRILDLQEEREAAIAQYQAALKIGDASTDTRNAAERGLKEPYQPPAARQQQQ